VEPLILLAALAGVFWFLLIRPQRQRAAAHRSLVEALKPGDEVITVGGVFGHVRSIADDEVVLEIAPGTEIRVAKAAVTNVVTKPEQTPNTAEEQPPTTEERG
jgi:preprotein translocase subunit YajC